ncbi:glycoside hydrolase family protein [Amycolatopsis thermophila]|uniref:Glycosyl hydrolases family 39 n=1 Tax=Amycolatopsis thermophila TaxID=206084 RepID=A0ABU0F3L4_9PSEU|nr:hypothetical protein [Amycolatopsis thermophila]MDQ0381968.1 hypothetical protein [Amycolatopsis thermophila]
MGIFAIVALLVAGLFSWAPGDRDEPPAPPAVALRPGAGGGLVLGVTHAQYSLDSWLTPGQRESGEQILGATPMLQNQHIMGFGVGNPEPVPGRYDWSRLDERMDLIGRTGGTPVITLCCAPDWMKGGATGTTNWDDLAAAPLRAHFADFARLSAVVAQRYPQVRYFQVWNELKGFWDSAKGRWDQEGYTDLYNQVYDAVKKVRPDALIGGPYVVINTWSSAEATDHPSELRGPYGVVDQRSLDVVEYWNEHKHGADFVALDASTATRDKGLITTPDRASQIYSDATRWARGVTGLPVWWSEFYPDAAPPADQPGAPAKSSPPATSTAPAASSTPTTTTAPTPSGGPTPSGEPTRAGEPTSTTPTTTGEPTTTTAPAATTGTPKPATATKSSAPTTTKTSPPTTTPSGQAPDNAVPVDQARAVATLDAVARAADAGAAAMLLWQPEASDDLPYAALWSQARAGSDVLRPTSLTAAWTWLAPRLRDGLVDVHRKPADLVQFVAPQGNVTINPQPRAAPLRRGGLSVTVPPLAILLPG